MKNLAVFVSGGGSNFQSILDAVKDKTIDGKICVLIASNPDAYAIKRADACEIPVFVYPKSRFPTPEDRDKKIVETLKNYGIDYCVLAGYLGIVTKPLIDAYPYKIINIHPALLPSYGGKYFYGLNVHRAVIEAKEAYSGATVHFVDCGTDTGPIILQEKLAINSDDTPEKLQERILENIEHKLLVRTVKLLCEDKVTVSDGKVIISE